MKKFAWLISAISLLVPIFVLSGSAYGQTVRQGTLLRLRMETSLSSETANIGDPFTASVISPIYANGDGSGDVLIPAGAIVNGHVRSVTRAKRGSQSGVIEVSFGSIKLPNGASYVVDGELTPLRRSDVRRVDPEGGVHGDDTQNRNAVFIGGGFGAGAVIGAIADGGRGAAIGAATGLAVGAVAVLLAKGNEAKVPVGTEFGMRLVRPIRLADTNPINSNSRRDNSLGRDSQPSPNSTRQSTAPVQVDRELMRQAQLKLTDAGYYNGAADGQAGPLTRAAIRDFQRAHRLAVTGQLDDATVEALGIGASGGNVAPSREGRDASGVDNRTDNRDPGSRDNAGEPRVQPTPRDNGGDGSQDVGRRGLRDSVAVAVISASAIRTGDGIQVNIITEVNTGGWRVFARHEEEGDTLKVYARGLPPNGVATQVIQRLKIDTNVTGNLNSIRRVVVYGSTDEPIVIDLQTDANSVSAGPPASNDVAGLPQSQVSDLEQDALDMLGSYRARLGMSTRTTSVFDSSKRYSDNEIQTLFALENFANSARLYAKLGDSVNNPDTLRSGAQSLLREFTEADRLIARTNLSDETGRLWGRLRQDMSGLSEQFHLDSYSRANSR